MTHKKMRIAKLLANYNQGSRREIERLIAKKKVFLNKKVVLSPITFVDTKDEITINNKKVTFSKKKELLKFYKPKNVICSKNKQDKRKIIYEIINIKYQNFIFVGRLDFNSEGLILLTNSSEISRNLELPKNNFEREYKVRVYGDFNVEKLKKLSKGGRINKKIYKPFRFKVYSKIKKNTNLLMTLKEGKKNEIREIFKKINLQVNKLKRISYGPFKLNKLLPGKLEVVTQAELEKYENYIRHQKR